MTRLDPPADDVGAFVEAPRTYRTGAADGPLAGATMAVKDLIDLAGCTTGAGVPDWAATHEPATADADAVAALVAAGVDVVARAITDELAWSLAGENVHHGTPTNVAAPGRLPGGSSSGCAAAVAAGLVDLGLATDTGGSIRVPASHCGIWGWRPTHGTVTSSGVVPLAPSFDTVGLLAADPSLLRRAAGVLLGAEPGARNTSGSGSGSGTPPVPVLWPTASWSGIEPPVRDHCLRLLDAAGLQLVEDPELDDALDLDGAADVFRTVQAAEAWAAHGGWITRVGPDLGPDVAARFAAAAAAAPEEVAAARDELTIRRAALRSLLAGGALLALPAAPGPAPPRGRSGDDAAPWRASALRLTAVGGVGALPAVAVPVAPPGSLPVGLALYGEPNTDLALMDLARSVARC